MQSCVQLVREKNKSSIFARFQARKPLVPQGNSLAKESANCTDMSAFGNV
jgi:hypothetical protein